MPEEKTVRVAWYNCDCPWTTKYCDEYHRSFAFVPVEVLNRYVNQAITDTVKKKKDHA